MKSLKKEIFSIRKCKLGIGSVLLCTSLAFVMGTQNEAEASEEIHESYVGEKYINSNNELATFDELIGADEETPASEKQEKELVEEKNGIKTYTDGTTSYGPRPKPNKPSDVTPKPGLSEYKIYNPEDKTLLQRLKDKINHHWWNFTGWWSSKDRFKL